MAKTKPRLVYEHGGFDGVKKRTSIGHSSRSKPKNKHKLRQWKKYNRQGK